MGFFKRLMRSGKRRLTEHDNTGLRCETQGEGEAYFVSLFQNPPEPLIFYFFDTREEATAALAGVSCIGIAQDSGKLVCTEVLTFGVFPIADESDARVWAALLAGKNLTHGIWSQARKSFIRRGGRPRREDEPAASTTQSPSSTSAGADASDQVTFSHESRADVAGFPAIRRFYRAPSKAAGVAWLKQHPVDQPSYFLVVESPDGAIARDIQGIYEP